MANRTENPFENEQPKLVHLEKDQSHYEYCRMQMHEINRVHKRTFFCNMALCMVVCLLAIFKVYIAGFSMLSIPFEAFDTPGMMLATGIFQIIIAMVIVILGYLAWANYHTLNIFLMAWYFIVTFIGIYHLDYLSAIVGAVGMVFYFFSIREMRHEETLAQMDGYPDFREKLDISKADIVIQTLMAHKGERRTKSTLFTTDYSLRRKKKKRSEDFTEQSEGEASAALAEALQQKVNDTKEARGAIEKLQAAAEQRAEEAAEAKEAAEKTAKAAAPIPDLTDDTAHTDSADTAAETSDTQPEQPQQKSAPQQKQQQHPNQGGGNRSKKKKKKK